jgi:hypothetical protein
VPVVTSAWLSFARLRRLLGRKPSGDWTQVRHRWIRDNLPGRSFADVGGMFGIHGEIALVAEESGASAVTLFDAGEPTPEFLERSRARGSAIRFVQGDLEDPVALREIGPHDVVWCTGVIYHTPNPVLQLMHLREITRELLYLGTVAIPEVPGVRQACVYYPYLQRAERHAYAAGLADPERTLAVGTPFDERPMYGHGNFWWGITPSALRAMMATARFEVVEERRPPLYPWGVEMVARPVPQHPSLPPVDYYRRRGERRDRGEPQLPFDGYYDKGPDAVASGDDIYPRLDGLPRDETIPRRWRPRRRLRQRIRR